MVKIRYSLNVIGKLASKYDVFSNPLRLLILKIISDSGKASWTKIFETLEEVLGKHVNPNTVNFHLTKLISKGIVVKTPDEQYMVNEDLLKKDLVLKTVLEEMKSAQ